MHLMNLRTRRVRMGRRKVVPIPTGVPTTDAVFLLLRRMRAPFVVLIVTFTVSMIGLSLIPGRTADGKPYKYTLFDAFYQVTMTVTTVGYTEAPHPFTYAQRMWMTASIFMLVVCWAYTIGVIFSIMQDSAFQQALGTQRFRRKVKGMREPFELVVGYGAAGQAVGSELDRRRRRFVVVEREQERVEAVWTDELHADVPAHGGDGKFPATLGLAGLGHPMCEAVLALTDDDEANLAVVMSAALLRPEIPCIARCVDKESRPGWRSSRRRRSSIRTTATADIWRCSCISRAPTSSSGGSWTTTRRTSLRRTPAWTPAPGWYPATAISDAWWRPICAVPDSRST